MPRLPAFMCVNNPVMPAVDGAEAVRDVAVRPLDLARRRRRGRRGCARRSGPAIACDRSRTRCPVSGPVPSPMGASLWNDRRVNELPSYDELPEVPGLDLRHAWDVFGRDDALGSINLVTPERVARAAAAVRTGQMIRLDLPARRARPAAVRAPGRTATRSFALNRHEMDDRLDDFHPQGSTQWDALGHVRCREHGFWGGRTQDPTDGPERARASSTGPRHGIAGRGVADRPRRLGRADRSRLRPARRRGPSPPTTCGPRSPPRASSPRSATSGACAPGWFEGYRAARRRRHAWPYADGAALRRAVGRRGDGPHDLERPPGRAVLRQPGRRGRPGDPAVGSLHRRLLPTLGTALGEMFDLDELAAACRADGRWTFFFVAAPLNLPGRHRVAGQRRRHPMTCRVDLDLRALHRDPATPSLIGQSTGRAPGARRGADRAAPRAGAAARVRRHARTPGCCDPEHADALRLRRLRRRRAHGGARRRPACSTLHPVHFGALPAADHVGPDPVDVVLAQLSPPATPTATHSLGLVADYLAPAIGVGPGRRSPRSTRTCPYTFGDTVVPADRLAGRRRRRPPADRRSSGGRRSPEDEAHRPARRRADPRRRHDPVRHRRHARRRARRAPRPPRPRRPLRARSATRSSTSSRPASSPTTARRSTAASA